MTTLQAAAQQALEALEHIMNYSSPHGLATITSTLRKALSQQIVASDYQDGHQPVAWTTMPAADDWIFISGSADPNGKLNGKWTALYTAPPKRKPIDDKTLWEMWVESPSNVLRFARAIEREHDIGEKE